MSKELLHVGVEFGSFFFDIQKSLHANLIYTCLDTSIKKNEEFGIFVTHLFLTQDIDKTNL